MIFAHHGPTAFLPDDTRTVHVLGLQELVMEFGAVHVGDHAQHGQEEYQASILPPSYSVWGGRELLVEVKSGSHCLERRGEGCPL